MKKRLLMIIVALTSLVTASADGRTAWVFLNNGNIVKGTVTKTDTKVFITTDDGSELSYPMLEVNRISYKAPKLPAVGTDPDLRDMADSDRGFWFSAQLSGAYTLFLSHHCSPWTELDLAGGYRFSQYLKVGIGVGGRYYIENSKLRDSSIKWSFPIYATVRGNFLPDTYRTVTPYYSVDLGGAIRDGFMWRPTFGIRVGQTRSAFLVGVSYTGQSLRYWTGKDKYVSSLGITVGYEF